MTLLLIILLIGSIVLSLVGMPCDVIAEGRAQQKCLGCTSGRFVPGCPVHDAELRKTDPRAVNREAVQTTRGTEV